MAMPQRFEDQDPVTMRIEEWRRGNYDENTKAEIETLLKSDPQKLRDAFASTLSFGTGGMRGIMGVGTCRMNIYTVAIATQGLADYLLKQFAKKKQPSVFIGFDNRNHSREFAEEAARVLAGNQIKVFLCKEIRPTPLTSFGCRLKQSDAGIMITASHNPAEYNGYKVYWGDGAQVVAPHDVGIIKEVDAISGIEQVKRADLNSPLIEPISDELDQAYLKAIAPLQHYPELAKSQGNALKICYTSLHGTGSTMMEKALKEWGFTNVTPVREQIVPDGNFPTVRAPNPELKDSLKIGIDYLTRLQSDLLLASDADADRIGVVVLHQNQPVILNGNEIAALCVNHLCETLTKQNKLPKNGAFVTTIVTTDLLKAIATSFNIACFEVLTGFKYIGEQIRLWETSHHGHQFIFGAEESYGYLLGTQTRDKDAIIAGCLLSEIALCAKNKGLTLVDFLYEIYKKYGIFREKQVTIEFPPEEHTAEKMKKLMEHLRKEHPKEIGGKKVLFVEDYLSSFRKDCKTGAEEKLTLPKSNVLLFRLEDESKFVVRPSGTEPKIKVYGGVFTKEYQELQPAIAECDQRLDFLLQSMKKLLA
jgi:phosphomannomutase